MDIDPIIDESVATLNTLKALHAEIAEAVDLIVEAFSAGRKLLSCGNGGSAADAAHFATEFLCRFVSDRNSLPAISLSCDGSFLTATSNDYGFDYVFARQIEGLAVEGDILVGITTSGNSPNVIRALTAAKEKGVKSIALLGRDGGKARGIADVEIVVPSEATARIQEAHTLIIHLLCQGVEERLFPELYAT